ncbi:MAG TPA: hypothetical protein VFH77_07670 [Streptomyces sp.]|nr:hypothetical protein [Streptomyces sp.]
MGRRTVWPVVTGVAAAGAAVALVLTLTRGGGDEKQHVQPAPVPTTSAAPTPEPTETTSPDITDAPPPLPPEGYEKVDDREGFRIAVPRGWSRSEEPSLYGMPVVDYCERDKCEDSDIEADDSHYLRIFQVEEETPKASFDKLLSDERYLPDGFHQLKLKDLSEGDFVGWRLEYLYPADSDGEPGIVTLHAYDLRFVAPDGNIYSISVYGPDDDGRDDELEILTRAVAWFCPPDTECPAPTPSPAA